MRQHLRRRGQGGHKQVAKIKGRVSKNRMPMARGAGVERGNAIAPLHLNHRLRPQLGADALQLQGQAAILLHQPHLLGPARSGFKAQGPGARKGVQAAPAGQILPQPVEQGFAHAVGRGAQAGALGHAELGAPPLAADDAHLACTIFASASR